MDHLLSQFLAGNKKVKSNYFYLIAKQRMHKEFLNQLEHKIYNNNFTFFCV